jgi:SAM-dependent methyltransferase
MSTAAPAGRGTYTLPNEWEHARRRLQLLEAGYDPGTVRRLSRLEVGPGWRCLEVGGGAGSITRWLASRVGPEGRVVAVDLETRFLDEIDDPTVEIHQLNLAVDDLPPGPFDLVHARAVLSHIPERDDILTRLLASLRPGGRLLLEEPDNATLLSLATGLYRDAWVPVLDAMVESGFVHDWGRQLPALFQRHGLTDMGAECEGTFFPGGSGMAEFIQLIWIQLRDRAIAAGATEDLLDSAAALLDDPASWFPAVPLIAAWGRRPA